MSREKTKEYYIMYYIKKMKEYNLFMENQRRL